MIRKIGFLLMVSWIGLTALACAKMKAGPDESVARDFMEAYYVQADLEAAQALSDGLAQSKVNGSQALREGLAIDTKTFHPRVSYKLIESKSGPEESEFIYHLEYHPEKAEEVRKKTRLKVRLRGGQWKVTQFSDYDL